MTADELLIRLEENVRSLLSERETLRQELALLRDANDRQRQELIRTHEELASLQRQYKQLQTAHALAGNEEGREQAKRQLSRLIRMVDTAIEQMNSETLSDSAL
ncbi:MAG: hypothetical protein IJ169_05105 [Paludibacteraceae bacterium]|nr:hypothetical protein [Paludibacteraceae bacterium]